MPWKRRKSSKCKVDVAHAQLIQSFELLNRSMRRPKPFKTALHIAANRGLLKLPIVLSKLCGKDVWTKHAAGAKRCLAAKMKWNVSTAAWCAEFLHQSVDPFDPSFWETCGITRAGRFFWRRRWTPPERIFFF